MDTNKFVAFLVIASAMSAAAMVKPLEGPWLKPGEKLVCFGDSITAGKDYYVKYLRPVLETNGVTVVNAGLSGDKTPMALTRIRDVAAEKPDAVMIFFGTNDSLVGKARWRDEPTVSPEAYRDNLLWMIHYLKRQGVKKFSIVAPAGCCEGEGLLEYGVSCPAYAQMARVAADRSDAVLVPLDIVFALEHEKSAEGFAKLNLTLDGIHFSEKGSRLAADAMLKAWNMKGAPE
ncbi:MAG: hypothetical protein II863_13435 [Kiritimatiellae bacterium]|nr:hypothetical protein [Kiritimatiellia bacterium]